MEGYWFRSSRFQPVPGEEREAAPGLHGRQLAYWLRDGLRASGYPLACVQAHDWGWCVIAQQRPCLLWVGCGGLRDDAPSHALRWHCHAVAEPRGWSRLFGRRRVDAALRELDRELRGLLTSLPGVELVDAP